MRCTQQGDIELMPEKEILDFKPALRLEQVGNKGSNQLKDRKQRVGMMR
jgi:hypothetical protein